MSNSESKVIKEGVLSLGEMFGIDSKDPLVILDELKRIFGFSEEKPLEGEFGN